MSWLFSQALVAEYSAGTCLAGAPSAQLNVMDTPHKFSRNDKTMAVSDHSRFGLTSAALTADAGEALLTSYLAAFPVRTSVLRGGGVGISGTRSSLWSQQARIVREVEPEFVYVENSPMLTSRGLGLVLGDLAEMGFDAEWGVLSAADTGAPHLRERIWILANASGRRCSGATSWQMEQPWRAETFSRGEALANSHSLRESQHAGGQCERGLGTVISSEVVAHTDRHPCGQGWSGDPQEGPRGWDADRSHIGTEMADAVREREQRIVAGQPDAQERCQPSQRPHRPRGDGFGRWPTEPGMGRVADGVAHRVDRIKALGNGQVPRVAAAAFTVLGRTGG